MPRACRVAAVWSGDGLDRPVPGLGPRSAAARTAAADGPGASLTLCALASDLADPCTISPETLPG